MESTLIFSPLLRLSLREVLFFRVPPWPQPQVLSAAGEYDHRENERCLYSTACEAAVASEHYLDSTTSPGVHSQYRSRILYSISPVSPSPQSRNWNDWDIRFCRVSPTKMLIGSISSLM
jgi:hypothetical protein